MTIDTTTMTEADKKALFAQLKNELEPKLTPRDPEIAEIVKTCRELATTKKVKVSDVALAVLTAMRMRPKFGPGLAEQIDADETPAPVEPAAPEGNGKAKK